MSPPGRDHSDDHAVDMQRLGAVVAAAIASSASTLLELATSPQTQLVDVDQVPGQDAAAVIAQDVLGDRRLRAAEILQAAAPIAALTVAQLAEAITARRARADLVIAALSAAVLARFDAKVDALTRIIAVAAVASDGKALDEHRMVVRALAQLEGPHVQVLQLISRPRGHHSRVGDNRSVPAT